MAGARGTGDIAVGASRQLFIVGLIVTSCGRVFISLQQTLHNTALALAVSGGLALLGVALFRRKWRQLNRLRTEPSAAISQPEDSPAVLSPDAATGLRAQLQHRLLVALLVEVLLGWVLLIAGVAGILVLANHSQWLLTHGQRTDGVVVALHGSGDGDHFDVAYDVSGRHLTGAIYLNSNSPTYHVGEHVTVVFDPKHPHDIRTTEEQSEQGTLVGFNLFGLVFGALFVVLGFVMLLRQRWMSRLVQSGRWRRADVYGNARARVVAVDDGSGGVHLATLAVVWWPQELRYAQTHSLLVARSARHLLAVTTDAAVAKPLRIPKRKPARGRLVALYRSTGGTAPCTPFEPDEPDTFPDPAGYIFNVPPGWPPPPPGFVPPPGWQPDPSWPPAPEGWRFWVHPQGW